jgi:hypothetical protein
MMRSPECFRHTGRMLDTSQGCASLASGAWLSRHIVLCCLAQPTWCTRLRHLEMCRIQGVALDHGNTIGMKPQGYVYVPTPSAHQAEFWTRTAWLARMLAASP